MRGKEERGGPSSDLGVQQEHAGKVLVRGWELPRTPTSAPCRGAGLEVGERPAWGCSSHVYCFVSKQKINNNNHRREIIITTSG